MKKFIKALVVVMMLPIAWLCCACTKDESPISIKSIAKTDSVGLVDTYTITYTDNTTSNFTIVNGEDGENLFNNITVNDLYNQVKDSKAQGYSLIDFIDEYLDIQIDTTAIASSKALRSAVSIFVEFEVDIVDYNNITGYTMTMYGKEPTYGVKKSISLGGGAGVIYSLDKTTGDAYIITNYHVCFNTDTSAKDGIATRFILYTYGSGNIDLNNMTYLQYYNNNCKDYGYLYEQYDAQGKPVVDYGYGAIEAEYVGGSENYDIAVLKVSGSDLLKNSDCIAAEVYNSDDVTAGSRTIAAGNPAGEGISVTDGVISVDSEYISVKISDVAVTLRVFRTDTAVNNGNSGGGLFDGFGRLIGIVNARTPDTTEENIGYAIPSNIAKGIADSIIRNCDGESRKTQRIFLGVTLQVANSYGYYDSSTGLMRIKEKVEISKTEGDSLAQEIGLKKGDIITSIDIIKPDTTISIEVNRLFTAIDFLWNVEVGDCIKINYVRGEVEGSAISQAITSENFIKVN